MKEKVVIVTGGSRGIGKGISKVFYEAGAKLVINYRQNEAAAKAFKQSFDDEERIFLSQADVGNQEDRSRLVHEVQDHFGQIDVLINNAGIAAKKDFLKESEDEFDDIINTNLKGPIFLAKRCAQQMIEKGIKGSIVNITSVSAHTPNGGTSYCAAKAGLLLATKRMAYKLGQHGIRVNSVTPGTVRSDMNRAYWEGAPDKWAELTQQQPLQRGGEPKELAEAVLFLASDKGSYITGSDLIVDGGWMLKPVW